MFCGHHVPRPPACLQAVGTARRAMKRLAVVLLCVAAANASAEDETLVQGPIESGGFGGPVVKFSAIQDDFALFIGGRGGWIINHTFTVGGGGYGLVNEIESEYWAHEGYDDVVIHMGYGGLILEYVHMPRKLIHLSVAALVGGGGFGFHERVWRYDWDESDAFFVTEPEVNLMLNVTEHFRIGLGASYRYVTGVNLEGIEDSDLSGFCGNLTLKFGRF